MMCFAISWTTLYEHIVRRFFDYFLLWSIKVLYSFNLVFKFNTFIPLDSRTIFTVKMKKKIWSTSLSHSYLCLIQPISDICFYFFCHSYCYGGYCCWNLEKQWACCWKEWDIVFSCLWELFPFLLSLSISNDWKSYLI